MFALRFVNLYENEKITLKSEGRIFLSGSSQGEISIMRVRLEGHKKTITNMH